MKKPKTVSIWCIEWLWDDGEYMRKSLFYKNKKQALRTMKMHDRVYPEFEKRIAEYRRVDEGGDDADE